MSGTTKASGQPVPRQPTPAAQAAPAPTAQAAVPDRPADQVDTPEGMKRVKVVANFTLGRVDGSYETFTVTGTNCGIPGSYDMAPDDAEHWWTIAHSADAPPPPPPMVGTQAYVEQENTKIRRRALHADALDQEAHHAAEEVRRDKQKRIAEQLGETGGSFEQAP